MRNRCLKHGINDVFIKKINEDSFVIAGLKWHDTVALDLQMLNIIIQTGYFRLDKNLADIPISGEEKIIVSEYILFKKYRNRDEIHAFSTLSLIGGIVTVIISFALYLTDSTAVGTISYSRLGNQPGYIALNWYHILFLGMILILLSFLIKYRREQEK